MVDAELCAFGRAKGDVLLAAADGFGIERRFAEALERYAIQGIATGDFLRAFLANDLMMAIGWADDEALAQFRKLALYVHNVLGSECHGSYEKVDAWLASPMTREKVGCHGF